MRIAEAAMMLPVEQRLVLKLRYKFGWSIIMIAQRTGLTQGEVTRAARHAVATVVALMNGTPRYEIDTDACTSPEILPVNYGESPGKPPRSIFMLHL